VPSNRAIRGGCSFGEEKGASGIPTNNRQIIQWEANRLAHNQVTQGAPSAPTPSGMRVRTGKCFLKETELHHS